MGRRRIGTKKCSICGVEYPATMAFFPPDFTAPSGLRANCRVCDSKRRRHPKPQGGLFDCLQDTLGRR